MRAFLTLLGVIIGVATVVGVVSVISGPERLRQGQGHRPESRHRDLHEVRDHHEPRRVADRHEAPATHADGHGDRPPRVPPLRAGRRAGRPKPAGQVRRPEALGRRDPGPHAEHGRGDELRHRRRAATSPQAEYDHRGRRRGHRLGRAGPALSERRPDRPRSSRSTAIRSRSSARWPSRATCSARARTTSSTCR